MARRWATASPSSRPRRATSRGAWARRARGSTWARRTRWPPPRCVAMSPIRARCLHESRKHPPRLAPGRQHRHRRARARPRDEARHRHHRPALPGEHPPRIRVPSAPGRRDRGRRQLRHRLRPRARTKPARRGLGVAAVIAPSYSGLYFRNAFNLGLLLLTCAEATGLREGDRIAIDIVRPALVAPDGRLLACEPGAGFLMEMVRAGGPPE